MKTRESRIYRVTVLGSIVNLLLLLFKFAAGILGRSAAMVADAIHSLSDFVTDIIVLLFVKVSALPADERHDYGHGKYETLASQIIGLILGAVGVTLGWHGIQKIVAFAQGETLEAPGVIALVAALLSILLKEGMYRITHVVAKRVDSSALEANAWHHRSDALSSVGTAVGVGGAILLGERWTVLDPIAAVIVSVFIVAAAIKLVRQASEELLEKSLPAEVEAEIVQIVREDKAVCDVHKLRTRKIGNAYAIDMHIHMDGDLPLREAHAHADDIESRLKARFGEGTMTMLHLEPMEAED